MQMAFSSEPLAELRDPELDVDSADAEDPACVSNYVTTIYNHFKANEVRPRGSWRVGRSVSLREWRSCPELCAHTPPQEKLCITEEGMGMRACGWLAMMPLEAVDRASAGRQTVHPCGCAFAARLFCMRAVAPLQPAAQIIL
jgi:hypothetical protein